MVPTHMLVKLKKDGSYVKQWYSCLSSLFITSIITVFTIVANTIFSIIINNSCFPFLYK